MILRVFPSRTNATPADEWVRFGPPGLFEPFDQIEEVHISVTFTWDKECAFRLFAAWKEVHSVVKIGGPALGDPGRDFISSRYLAIGNVITSRGCPNKCSYCMAREREGDIRELPIREGWRVHDNNLLACSPAHVIEVCKMLARQSRRAVLAGGLDAKRFEPWHASLFRETKIDRMYFANDRPGDIEAIRCVAAQCRAAGFTRDHHLYCYVLIGHGDDTVMSAETRLKETWKAGMVPYAMLWRGIDNSVPAKEWKKLQRKWLRPAIIKSRMAALIGHDPQ